LKVNYVDKGEQKFAEDLVKQFTEKCGKLIEVIANPVEEKNKRANADPCRDNTKPTTCVSITPLVDGTEKMDDKRFGEFKKRKKSFYNTLFHEFGHCLGLVDEYMSTANANMKQRQEDMGAWATTQAAPVANAEIDLWMGSQLDWANALDEPVCIQPHSTASVMNAGFQIFKVHYVTAFMALCDLYKQAATITAADETELRNICKATWAIVDTKNTFL